MASFASPDRDREQEAACLKQKFRAVSRRIEWRERLKKAAWWITLCGVAFAGAFVAMATVQLFISLRLA